VRAVGIGLAALVMAAGCFVATNGTGSVGGSFFVKGCRPSGDRPPGPYAFEADRMATQRIENVLEIIVQEYHVDLEESDGLLIRIPDVRELRALSQAGKLPIRRTISMQRNDVNAALSLFQTCPDRPTLNAVSGTLTFDRFEIAALPEDTGNEEALKATLTATVTSVERGVPVGHISAVFDFIPSTRAITEPQ